MMHGDHQLEIMLLGLFIYQLEGKGCTRCLPKVKKPMKQITYRWDNKFGLSWLHLPNVDSKCLYLFIAIFIS